MANNLLNDGRIRLKSRLCETHFVEPMRVGASHIELKLEIYEDLSGVFSSSVFAKRVFLLEPAFMSGDSMESERRGMVSLFVEDLFYDTHAIRLQSAADALDATLRLIRERLLSSGEAIEYLIDVS